MDAIEKRARAMLDSSLKRAGSRKPRLIHMDDALHAIIAALTPPEGFVLVPVEPTDAMKVAGLRELNPLGELVDWNDPDCLSRVDMAYGWAAMLAARPEVVDVQ